MHKESLLSVEPIEMIDSFAWTKQQKIVPRGTHSIKGLANMTHSHFLSASPATEYHYHHNIMEIFCIVKGRRECTVYDGKQFISYEFTGNEALVVFPDEPHISGSSGLDPCDMYALQCDLSEGETFLGLNPEAGQRLCRALRSLPGRHIMLDPTAYMLLRCAFERFSTMTEEGYVEASAFLSAFLYTLIHLPCVHSSALEAPNDRIHRVLDYIEDNIAQPLSLTELADCAGYSLSRFKTLFRQVTGQTPAQYISMCKVEKAKKLLCRGEKNITEIAYDLGWSSSNYFCAVFKKYTNISPLIYRKMHHGEAGE